uniref:Zasp-like motif domain-containing protein n=1 Tax=Cuerna arida TaxID=1464854 RepID=A0A1B6F9G7_9HEMI
MTAMHHHRAVFSPESDLSESPGYWPYRTTPLVLPGAKIKKDALPTESYLRHHPNPLMRAPPPLHGLPHEVLMKQKVVPQFNSPIGLYSEDNIVNTIQQQTGATPIFIDLSFLKLKSQLSQQPPPK